MKKLILLLLPLFSFSQTYKDVMSIKSLDAFKRVAIENNFEYSTQSGGDWITYGYYINGDAASKWMNYNPKEERFSFFFTKSKSSSYGTLFGFSDETPYDEIYAVVKDKCTYFKILNYKGDDYVCYSCPESTYKGKIGFMIQDEKGYIRNFPESKSIAEN